MHDQKMEEVNTAAQAEYLKVQTAQEKEQSDAIKALVAGGINPVAARCAILGWETERDAIVCATAGAKKPNTTGNISE